jgi:hypothetical protein
MSLQIPKETKPTIKLKFLLWIDEKIVKRWTFFWWDISQWFCNHNYHYKYSEFIEMKIESPVSRKWHVFLFDQGLEVKPLTKQQAKILNATLGAYLKCVEEGE